MSASYFEEDVMEVDGATDVAKTKTKARGKKDKGDELYKPSLDDGEDDDDNAQVQVRGSPKTKGWRSSKKYDRAAKETKDEKERKRSLKSRFLEGSMRDRPSEPPPPEYTGSSFDSAEDEEMLEEEEEVEVEVEPSRTTSAAASNLTGNTQEKEAKRNSRLGFFTKLNPFAIAENVKAAWVRQKKIAEDRERRKAFEARQKRRLAEFEEDVAKRYNAADDYARQYQEMKARGEFRGGVPPSLMMSGAASPAHIGQAFTTEEDGNANWTAVSGSAKKRKRAEMTSVGSSVDMPEFSYGSDNDQPEALRFSEEYQSPTSLSTPIEENAPASVFGQISTHRPLPPPPPTPASEPKVGLLKKTSRVFNSTFNISSSASASSSVSGSKVPTKRDIKRAERLKKKVSDLEEKLNKARAELLSSGIDIPPVPPLPSGLMAPPPVPHPTPVNNTGSASLSMPMYGPPETPYQQTGVAHHNEMMGTDDSVAVDADATMDEGFSMIPLSPVLNSSQVGIESILGNGGDITASIPALPPQATPPTATQSARKASGGNGAVVGGVKKPERKKRKGLDSPPPKKSAWTEEAVPPVPRIPGG
ncbi:hypothetical protein EDC01DRAFT_428367 [Geopyxis carbonaria]|nr:hypothetical protein EDC01DRAFT_428367 [Geopyxis carbonaria]